MTEQLKVALVRSTYTAILAGLSAGLFSYTQNANLRVAALVAAGAAVAALISRGMAEGWYDQGRASRGDVQPSDVGYAGVSTAKPYP